MLRVKTPDHIETTAALAREIWTQYYVPIIGQAQVDYMLADLQSVRAITQQIAGGYEYYLVIDSGAPVGYFAIVPNPAAHSALLRKIYVKQDRRGNPCVRKAMFMDTRNTHAFGRSKCTVLSLAS